MDAYPFGNTTVGPDEAYRFARGETVLSPRTMEPLRLRRPLDWLVVADHSEYLGMVKAVFEGDAEMLKNPSAKRWFDMVHGGKSIEATLEIINTVAIRDERMKNPKVKRTIWSDFAAIADRNNSPRSVHRLYRLRMDIDARWPQQPAPGRDLSRWQGQGENDGAVFGL